MEVPILPGMPPSAPLVPSIRSRNPEDHARLATPAARDLSPSVRLAKDADLPALEALIPLSVHALQSDHYSLEQRLAALGPVFGVDRQLIRDGTYFVVDDAQGLPIACGGWSRRHALFGSDQGRAGDQRLLDPQRDAARVRAFFVHPEWTRRGIARRILATCEAAIVGAGFRRIELVATLAGEPLYANMGYAVQRRDQLPLQSGLTLPVAHMSKALLVP